MEDRKKWLIADLHIHSKYSRACSKDLNFPNLVKWARIKGLNLLGTGDFTHPLWLLEIKNLKQENGIYYYEDNKGKFPFILSSEISLVYSKNSKGRRIHLVFFAPDLNAVDKINSWLDSKGRRDYDGRPIFNISCRDFAAKMEEIDKRIEVVCAHCLLPDSFIHLNNGVKKIKNVKEGDLVFTHKNRFKKVKYVLTRDYNGKIYRIRPWYFSEGLKTTPEHPFYIIKSYKNCKSTKGLCKPLCSADKNCRKKYYLEYKPAWVMAKDIEKGDFLVYPRLKMENDFDFLEITDFVKNYKELNKDYILPKNARNNRNPIKRKLIINNEFCRLIGYFLSEGYLIRNEAIGFSFNSKEKEYINEVIDTIKNSFGDIKYKIDSRRESQADIIFYSNIINEFFSNFYCEKEKRAWTKDIPYMFLHLRNEKLAEILRGWWRGDFGYSVSRDLINKMKLLCLKIGIIPSISINRTEDYNKREHFIGDRQIKSNKDLFSFSNLSFFDNDYGMLKEKCFKRSINKINRKHGWIDEDFIYLPVRKIEISNYNGEVYNLEVEDDNSYVSEFACVHNCWTPWFGIFGSKSGFDSLQEAFEDKIYLIHAVETGISSDPEMNWKIKDLDDKAIVSFSDSHSFWPWRLGREATIFKLNDEKLSYDDIIKQIREKSFIGTIETDPAYGIYHFDGHRNCNFSSSPEETKKLNGICPICGKPLTLGVDYRVLELEKLGKSEHKDKKFYYKLLPLHEMISLDLGTGLSTKSCWNIYNLLIDKFGNEYNVLFDVSREELGNFLNNPLLVDLIMLNRNGKIQVKPGYDGVYGKAVIGGKEISVEDESSAKVEVKFDKKRDTEQKLNFSSVSPNQKKISPFGTQIKQKRFGDIQKKLF